jgi:integrase
LVPRNVSELVDAPQMHRQEMKVWTARQTRTFLTAVSGVRLAALYTLALSTGMRQGELFGLRWKDVDLSGAKLSVVTAVQRSHSAGTRLAHPKTASGRRTIALTTLGSFNAVEALRSHRVRQGEERQAWGAEWKDMDLVFTDTLGGPLRGNNLERRHFGPLMRVAGVPRIRFHDLRHTAATLMIAAGVPVKVVSEMLGHADVGTTLRIYAHVLPNMRRDAADVLGRLLDG